MSGRCGGGGGEMPARSGIQSVHALRSESPLQHPFGVGVANRDVICHFYHQIIPHGGGVRCGAARFFAEGADYQQPAFRQSLLNRCFPPFFHAPRQDHDDRLPPFQKIEKHVLFERTMKTADHAAARFAHGDGPIIAAQHSLGGQLARTEEGGEGKVEYCNITELRHDKLRFHFISFWLAILPTIILLLPSKG